MGLGDMKNRIVNHYRDRRNRQIALLMWAVFLNVWAFATTIPIMSPLIIRLVDGDIEKAGFYYGILQTCQAIVTFFAVPIIGALSDVYKRRPFFQFALATLMINIVGMIIAYETKSMTVLFITFIGSGVGSIFTAIASAYIADLTTPETRSKYLGMIGLAFGAGFIAGPGMVAASGGVSYSIPLGIALGLVIINMVYVYFLIPESLDVAKPRFNYKKAIPLHSFAMLRESAYTILLSASFFLFTLADQGQIDIYAIYGSYRFGWTVTDIGAVMVLVGVTYMISQGIILRWVIRPLLGDRRGVILGMGVEILQAVLFGLLNAAWQVWPVTLLRLVSLVVSPILQGLISQRYPSERQGELMGTLRAIHTLADIITPFTVTSIFSYYISDQVSTKVPGVVFFIAAGLYTLSLILAVVAFTRFLPPTIAAPDINLTELPGNGESVEGSPEITTGRLTSPTQRKKKAAAATSGSPSAATLEPLPVLMDNGTA